MPNICGGAQDHPAYDPRTKLGPNEILVGNILYRMRSDGVCIAEDVDGLRWRVTGDAIPEALRKPKSD